MFEVYNKSVFDVTVEAEIKGYISLNDGVILREEKGIISDSKVISPSSYGSLIIEQRLSSDEFDLIAKRENSKKGAYFCFNKLEISIKIVTSSFQGTNARLVMPVSLSSREKPSRYYFELKEYQARALNIENLTLALGACYLAYKQIRRGQQLSTDDYQTLKDDIGHALDVCFGKEKGDEYFDQQPPFPSTLEEQDKWVDLQCKNIRKLIEKEKE